jgi:phage terminase small subunit
MKLQKPKWLNKLAGEYWSQLGEIVEINGTNKHAAALLATELATYRQASDQLEKEGYSVSTSVGTSKPHPIIGTRNQAVRNVIALSRELGIGSKQAPVSDELSDIFGGK